MPEHLDKRCSNKDNTKASSLASDISQIVEMVTLCARRKSKTQEISTLSHGNWVSTIEIPGNWQYSA